MVCRHFTRPHPSHSLVVSIKYYKALLHGCKLLHNILQKYCLKKSFIYFQHLLTHIISKPSKQCYCSSCLTGLYSHYADINDCRKLEVPWQGVLQWHNVLSKSWKISQMVQKRMDGLWKHAYTHMHTHRHESWHVHTFLFSRKESRLEIFWPRCILSKR